MLRELSVKNIAVIEELNSQIEIYNKLTGLGIEAVVIGKNTNILDFKRELRLNEVYYR